MSQFVNVISSRRLLILGSIISRITIFITQFDVDETDLHVVCPQTPLDLSAFNDIGLLKLKDSVHYIAPPGTLVPHEKRIYSKQCECKTQATPAPHLVAISVALRR